MRESNEASGGRGLRSAAGFRCHKVVAATDFSPTAARATAWAVKIARAYGAHLTLAHAVDQPIPSPGYTTIWGADGGAALQQAARERLLREAEAIAVDGVEMHTRLLAGIPAPAILDLVRELDADLLVAGTRGLSGLRHMLLGSTAERLVQGAPCPVLTTHGEPASNPPRRVLVPTDFTAATQEVIRVVRGLFGEGLANVGGGIEKLVLLHAYHLPIEYSAYGTSAVSPAFLEEGRVRAEAGLQEVAASPELEGLEVETVARAGYAVETILELVDELEIDLIAMGTAGRSGAAHFFLGSAAERVVQRASCPVLTLRTHHDEG